MQGTLLQTAKVELAGFRNDRHLMLVNSDGKFLTQREIPQMARIHPQLSSGKIHITATGMDPLDHAILTEGKRIPVEIWKSTGVEAVDQGNIAAEWFEKFLKLPVRLVRIADDFIRKVDPKYSIKPNDQVSFADGFPLLIVNQASLDDLNSRLDRPIPMNRFRPNLVVQGASPYAEDGWKRIRIGEVELALVKPCARCSIPATDQITGVLEKEPLQTLAKYRNFAGKIMFGVNILPITTGQVKTGMKVDILE